MQFPLKWWNYLITNLLLQSTVRVVLNPIFAGCIEWNGSREGQQGKNCMDRGAHNVQIQFCVYL